MYLQLQDGQQSSGVGRVLVRTGDAQPTVAGKPGDVAFNSSSAVDGYAGWIFVDVAEWRPYGKIE
jgi:hypothetical protein